MKDSDPEGALVTLRPLVALAEDDDEIRLALAAVLESDGFEVAAVADGEMLIETLGRCEEAHRFPDIIITDHRMPGYSGLDVLDGLRVAGWKVPVIFITAFADEVRPLAHALGARAVFRKPFDPDDLRTAVFYWINWSERRLPPGSPTRLRKSKRRLIEDYDWS